MLNEDALFEIIDSHYHQAGDRLFRFEGLPLYAVDADGDDFRRWQAGATEPTWSRKKPWLDTLRSEHERGLISRRVRLFSPVLTDYELYSAHFGYAYNARYEDIRVLRAGEHDIPDLIGQDYWIINDSIVLPMHYSATGEFIGADVLEGHAIRPYLTDRASAWEAAEPFGPWWQRHIELHRRVAA